MDCSLPNPGFEPASPALKVSSLLPSHQGSQSAIHIHVSSLPQDPLPSSLPPNTGQFPVPYSRFLLVTHFKYSSVCMTIPSSPTIPFPCKCLGLWNQVLRTASLQAVSHRQSLPGFIPILFLLKSCLWFLTAKCSCPLPVWCCRIPINFCSNKPLNFLIHLSLCFKM